MLIKIKPEEVKLAKELIEEFDAQKTHNKFNCKTNYVGILGEIVFDRHLTEQGIEHSWVKFIKKPSDMPDFFINNVAVDLKTTYSNVMWFQEPKFDVYVYAQISEDDKYLHVTSFISKQSLINYTNSPQVERVKRDNRVDYIIKPADMIDMSLFSAIRRV